MSIDVARIRSFWSKPAESFTPEDISWLKEHALEAVEALADIGSQLEIARTSLSDSQREVEMLREAREGRALRLERERDEARTYAESSRRLLLRVMNEYGAHGLTSVTGTLAGDIREHLRCLEISNANPVGENDVEGAGTEQGMPRGPSGAVVPNERGDPATVVTGRRDGHSFDAIANVHPEYLRALADAAKALEDNGFVKAARVVDHWRNKGAAESSQSNVQITDAMVDRFLSWRLPDDFAPDCGIQFTPDAFKSNGQPLPRRGWPVGTNLLTAVQARAMLEHVIGHAEGPTK